MNQIQKTEQALVPIKIESPEIGEGLVREPRVEIFGTRTNGVYNLEQRVQDGLQANGFPEMKVRATRLVHNIENGFYGRPSVGQQSIAPGQNPERQIESNKQGLVQRILGRRSLVGSVDATATDIAVPDAPHQDTLPELVIVMPEMRLQAEDATASRMTVNTPYEQIEALCHKHGVRIAYAEGIAGPDEIGQTVQRELTGTVDSW